MPSLIADFFKRNVVLNMKATEYGDRPNTVRAGNGVSPTISKQTMSEGVWNLPQGSYAPFVPMDVMSWSPEKKEEKNSLISNFFRRTVTLNNDAKDESKTQSAYRKPSSEVSWWSNSYGDLYQRYLTETLARGDWNSSSYTGATKPFDSLKCKIYQNMRNRVVELTIILPDGREFSMPISERYILEMNRDKVIDSIAYQALSSLNIDTPYLRSEIRSVIERSLSEYLPSTFDRRTDKYRGEYRQS